jgi:DNA polymerase (family 10)
MAEADTIPSVAEQEHLENAVIAERLEALATLLELADANPYATRAYRRAATLVRETKAPVAELVRAGRVRELRGIGPSIEARLRELVETGGIAEIEELERELPPDLIGLGNYIGLSARRTLEIARTLGIGSADELRRAARAGELRRVPGIGPQREAELLARLERGGSPAPIQRLRLDQARAIVERVAQELEGEPAGDVRRWSDEPRRLAVVVATSESDVALDRFASLPDIVAVVERPADRAVGVTVDGVALEAICVPRERYGAELLRATGTDAYVEALEPLPERPTEEEVYDALGIPFCPPELREQPFRGEPPELLALEDVRGDLHSHTTWSDGRASVLEMGLAARELGYGYLAICDHTPAVGAVRGLTPDELRRQAVEIAEANERLAPFRVLRGVECDILGDGSLDLPDSILRELDWVQASVHGGQRMERVELTKRVEEALRNPYVRCLSHPMGRMIGRRPENALDLERVIEVCLEMGVALEINGLPDRLDLRGERARLAVEAGVALVASTDAHSTRGLRNMRLAVATARRGWARAADVLNARPVDEVLRRRS